MLMDIEVLWRCDMRSEDSCRKAVVYLVAMRAHSVRRQQLDSALHSAVGSVSELDQGTWQAKCLLHLECRTALLEVRLRTPCYNYSEPTSGSAERSSSRRTTEEKSRVSTLAGHTCVETRGGGGRCESRDTLVTSPESVSSTMRCLESFESHGLRKRRGLIMLRFSPITQAVNWWHPACGGTGLTCVVAMRIMHLGPWEVQQERSKVELDVVASGQTDQPGYVCRVLWACQAS